MVQQDTATVATQDSAGPWRGTNQGGMREGNERLILSVLRRTRNLAKADLARITGLSAQTVARLIQSLETDGLILRGVPQKGRIGQPSVPLSLNPRGAVFLGMKVGRRSVEMIAIDFLGEILDQRTHFHDYPDFDTVRDFALNAAEALIAGLPLALQGRVGGLGIAMPFFLWNWAAQIGVAPERMENWKTRDLEHEIAEALDIPVFVQNDATAACSAALVFGDDEIPANTLSIFLAFFVGGGLVINRALYSGSEGNAAGFAPMQVPDREGKVTRLIDIASLSVLEKRLQVAGCETRDMWLDPDVWTFPDDIVTDWLDYCGHGLAQAIHGTQTILDLDAVLIEGWLPRDRLAQLESRVVHHLSELDLAGIRLPLVRAGTVGKDARALGAASLPLSHRYLTA